MHTALSSSHFLSSNESPLFSLNITSHPITTTSPHDNGDWHAYGGSERDLYLVATVVVLVMLFHLFTIILVLFCLQKEDTKESRSDDSEQVYSISLAPKSSEDTYGVQYERFSSSSAYLYPSQEDEEGSPELHSSDCLKRKESVLREKTSISQLVSDSNPQFSLPDLSRWNRSKGPETSPNDSK